jgi:hypothetical protein
MIAIIARSYWCHLPFMDRDYTSKYNRFLAILQPNLLILRDMPGF